MNAITTTKTALLAALDGAGYGFSVYNGQQGANAKGALQLSLYLLTSQAGAISTAQKAALATALETAGYEYTAMQNQPVWDEGALAMVPGLVVVLVPVPAAAPTT
jgi:hypothetical protein